VFVFLKDKLGQVATPFSQRAGTPDTRRSGDEQPGTRRLFVDYPVVSDLRGLLQALTQRLEVDPECWRSGGRRSRRRRGILRRYQRVTDSPRRPFFFGRLNRLVESLIVSEDYSYTGVYDVGREIISAIRNLSRAGPGFRAGTGGR